MAYQDLYQGRKAPTQAPAPVPQPVGVSMVEHLHSLNQLPLDASGGTYTQAERQQAREIKQLMAEGRFGIGQIIPHRLMPLVFDGAVPESMVEMQASTHSSIVGRLAAKIDASLATDAPVTRRGLATDNQPGRGRNDLAPHTHQLHSNDMSYRLRQVMGDYSVINEEQFEAELIRCGVHDVAERIALKHEGYATGVLRPRGTVQAQRTQHHAMTYMPGMMSDDDAMTYQPGMMSGEVVEHADGTTTVTMKGKIDKGTADKWRKLLQPTKGKVATTPDGEGLTLKASADDGTCAYDKTAFWVASGLNTL